MIELIDLAFAVVFGATTMAMVVGLTMENRKIKKRDRKG